MKFAVSHLHDSRFEAKGLRAFFEYRDLGIQEATGGKVVAHVIRARPGEPLAGGTHHHEVHLQLMMPAEFETVVDDAPAATCQP